MKNLKSVIQYECMTSFKYIWVFYLIQYLIVGFITVLIGLIMGSFEDVGTNLLEGNTLIYVGVLGVLGFTEDFKMLIQHGFTRKYIFLATFALFCFIAGIMALVDTAVGNVLHFFNNNYTSLYGGVYGYGNLFMNWLWLFLVYMIICSFLYLVILLISRLGKSRAIFLGVGLGGMILLVIAMFQYVLSAETVSRIIEFLIRAMGFMKDGTVNYFFPVLSFLILTTVLGAGCYAVIRRTELK